MGPLEHAVVEKKDRKFRYANGRTIENIDEEDDFRGLEKVLGRDNTCVSSKA